MPLPRLANNRGAGVIKGGECHCNKLGLVSCFRNRREAGPLLFQSCGYETYRTVSIGMRPARTRRSRKKKSSVVDFLRAFWKTVASPLLSRDKSVVSCCRESSRRDRLVRGGTAHGQ